MEVADTAPYEIRVRGLVKESTFKKADLQTMTELRYVPGSNSFSLHDVLTNHADYPHDYQIIYHSNFGKPILEEGARFMAPIASISPFNDYAKAGLKPGKPTPVQPKISMKWCLTCSRWRTKIIKRWPPWSTKPATKGHRFSLIPASCRC
ncbi:thioredoxin-like protein [Klebsiella michiganensis]|nr:thioredoxin-like protein [Klebsiella michiganensis]